MTLLISREELHKETDNLQDFLRGTGLYIISTYAEDDNNRVIRVAVGGDEKALTEEMIKKLQLLGYEKRQDRYWCVKLFILKD